MGYFIFFILEVKAVGGINKFMLFLKEGFEIICQFYMLFLFYKFYIVILEKDEINRVEGGNSRGKKVRRKPFCGEEREVGCKHKTGIPSVSFQVESDTAI